jgi:hypothetical protein
MTINEKLDYIIAVLFADADDNYFNRYIQKNILDKRTPSIPMCDNKHVIQTYEPPPKGYYLKDNSGNLGFIKEKPVYNWPVYPTYSDCPIDG